MKEILKLVVIVATLYAVHSFITGAATPALMSTHEPTKQVMIYTLTVLLVVGISAVGVGFYKIIDKEL